MWPGSFMITKWSAKGAEGRGEVNSGTFGRHTGD